VRPRSRVGIGFDQSIGSLARAAFETADQFEPRIADCVRALGSSWLRMWVERGVDRIIERDDFRLAKGAAQQAT
jgi:hypothetical protein